MTACVGYNYTINEPQKWIYSTSLFDVNTIFTKLGTKLLNYKNKVQASRPITKKKQVLLPS